MGALAANDAMRSKKPHRNGGLDSRGDEPNEPQKIHLKMQELLDQPGRTQAALAKALGVSPNRITRWVSQYVGAPRPHEIILMARYFDVTVESLIDDAIEHPMPKDSVTSDERVILEMARTIGVEETKRRILTVNEPRIWPIVQTEGDIEAARRKAEQEKRDQRRRG